MENTPIRTRLESLILLRNDQLELVLNREAGVRMLEKKAKIDPNEVLMITPDLEKLEPKVVTVQVRLEEMKKAYNIDLERLMTYDAMIKEEKDIAPEVKRTDVEQG